MKISNKRELQQTAFNHSSDTDFQDFMSLYKTCTAKPYSLLVIGTTLTSANYSRFRKNLLERIKKLIMTIDDNIIYEQIQYDINREAAKILALSSEKIDKYEHLTDEKILPSDQSRVIERGKFTYSWLIKTKKDWRTRKQQVEALEVLKANTKKLTIKDSIPKNKLTIKTKNKVNKIKGIEKWQTKKN